MQKAHMDAFYTHAAYEECENNTSRFTQSEYGSRQQLSTDPCCTELCVCGLTEGNKGSQNANINNFPHFKSFKQSWMGGSLFFWVAGFRLHFLCFCFFAPVVLSRQQRRVQLMRIQQREERLKKDKENKKKKKRQNLKSTHKQKSLAHHHPRQQYHHPSVAHPHHQPHSSQTPKVPPSQTEPGYHRKANNKRRFDGDVLSPVRCSQDVFTHPFTCISLARGTVRSLSLIAFFWYEQWLNCDAQQPIKKKKKKTKFIAGKKFIFFLLIFGAIWSGGSERALSSSTMWFSQIIFYRSQFEWTFNIPDSTLLHLSAHRATSGASGTDTRTDERTLTLEW